MDTAEKLALLGSAARYEIAVEGYERRIAQPTRSKAPARRSKGPPAALCAGEGAEGRTGTLLRVLQSSRCEHDCAYCPLRRSNDPQRASFNAEELAGAFAQLWQRGRVDGLMLSSATDGSPDQAMQGMLDTVQVLRATHGFAGYVHLKVLPGASRPAIEEAARLADRLSLNVETPDEISLSGLLTGKRWLEDIVQRLGWLHELDSAGAIRSGISSQLLVGVGSASDRALATGSRSMRRDFGLRRMHFGDFQPAPGTPLADQAAPDPRRRAHLYQWDWLATHYDFSDSELDTAFDPIGNLPLGLDPKLAVSLARPQERPTEVNTATYEELLRVPGIGTISARRIVDLRYLGALTELQDLRALGVTTGRAAPFILLNGRRPPEAGPAMQRIHRQIRHALEPQPVQLALWPEDGWPTLSP